MSEYQLELKQIVEFSRCRIYRQFIRTLMDDRSIRVSGGSGLFYFTVLCSYANFRTSYKRIGGINYTIYPGEWICKVDELRHWFRSKYQHQALSILDMLQQSHRVSYSLLGRGKVVKFKISGWRKHNTVLDYNAPCQKDTGFFFMPVSTASELISTEHCSEMDILLDMWLNTIYNDEQVQGSEAGPVVYMRNGTGSPLVGYAELGERWGVSKATVGRVLKKLSTCGYLTLLTFPGRHGSVICLNGYLSTMFQISDVIIDKEEVAMSLNINITVKEISTADTLPDDRVCVSNDLSSVSKSHICIIVEKVEEVLSAQGIPCIFCPKSIYKLSPLLPGCQEIFINKNQSGVERKELPSRFKLELCCGSRERIYIFEISLVKSKNKSLGGHRYEKQ